MTDRLTAAAAGAEDRFQMWARLLRRAEATKVAEVGVFRGEFAAKMLRRVPQITEYLMVDPWRHLDDWNKPANRDNERFERMYRDALQRTDFAADRRRVLRGTTLEVSNEVEDGTLDFVYVDGDHTLRGITIDLHHWLPNVRHGGWLAGDDFTNQSWQHGTAFDPTLVFPYAVFFAEAVGVPIHALSHNQFLIENRPEAGFRFNDTTGNYSEVRLQHLLATPGAGKKRRTRRAKRTTQQGPIFIVGCGRSGTTALGEAVATHPGVTYLNEPRSTWEIDPRTLVWSSDRSEATNIDLGDVEPDVASEIRRAFESATAPGTLLVEKTPINAFRIDFIRTIFPDARFVHLLRNGQNVARSIAERVDAKGRWYGRNDAKWRLLEEYAARAGLGDLADFCGDDPRKRGLLEWRLAVTHIRRRLTTSDLEIRYERLVADPDWHLGVIAKWAGLEPGEFGPVDLTARTEPITEIDDDAATIAGDLLRVLGYGS